MSLPTKFIVCCPGQRHSWFCQGNGEADVNNWPNNDDHDNDDDDCNYYYYNHHHHHHHHFHSSLL